MNPDSESRSARQAGAQRLEQQYQDSLIARHLPKWMAKVKPVHAVQLREALMASLDCRHRLVEIFARVEGIDTFATRLLQQALNTHHPGLDAGQLYYRQWYTFSARGSSTVAGRWPGIDSDYYEIGLVEAALYNFTEAQTQPLGQRRRNCIVDSAGKMVGNLTALAFARLCRTLDIGQQYQRHLDSVLTPSLAAGQADALTYLQRLQASTMLADAVQAHAQGVLNEAELALVIELCRNQRLGTLHGAPVVARQMQAFGCWLQQVVVLEVVDEGWLRNTTKRVLIYIPADPRGPWCTSDDLEQFARRVLGKRLRDGGYQNFFSRFVLRRDRQAFFTKVKERLGDVADWATRDLDEHMREYPRPLASHLATACIRQIKDDAALIAMPKTQIDRQLQQAHHQRLLATGQTLLAVASLFVPALGGLLLLVMGWELLEEVFLAVEDWHEGDTRAALGHLAHVAEDVAWVGATAAGVAGARKLWQRSAFVDGLVPARLENGTEKLWQQDLTPFRSKPAQQASAADERGVREFDEKQWIEMDGHDYAVAQRPEDDQWYLLPKRSHAPALRHNGAGAWRVWYEQPGQWQDSAYLLRRLGGEFSRLDDQEVEQLMAIHGLDGDQLRALHVYAKPADAEVLDTLQRIVLVRRVKSLVHGLRTSQLIEDTHALALARQLPGAEDLADTALAEVAWRRRRLLFRHLYEGQLQSVTTQVETLQRAFPSVHRLAAAALLDAASDEDLQRLSDTGRIPLMLAQAARASALHIRAIRTCEALFIDTDQTLDLAKAVLALVDEMPGAANGPRWQLYDGDALAPLLSTHGQGRTYGLIFSDGQFTCVDALSVALREPDELFAAMSQAYDEPARQALNINEPFALNLRRQLAQRVKDDNQALIKLLGKGQSGSKVLAPMRVGRDRIGYPLSGRGGGRSQGPRSLAIRLRDLYPAYSDEQVADWLARVEATGRDGAAELAVLEAQAQLLLGSLKQWQLKALVSFEWSARRRFKDDLIMCWRQLIPARLDGEVVMGGYSWMHAGSRLKSLPVLPPQISFDHVSALALRGMKLASVPAEFLGAFPNLRTLEITGNKLERLSLPADLLGTLEVLDVSHNRITLDQTQILMLNACSSLVYINLSSNPLFSTFSVAAMPRLNVLRLRNTRIGFVPTGIETRAHLHTLDLSDNMIRNLPEHLGRSVVWNEGYVDLSGNPMVARQNPDWQLAWREPRASRVPYRLRWMDRIDAGLRDELATSWASVEAKPESEDFFLLLSNLTHSSDFQNNASAGYLAARVLQMLDAMLEEPAVCTLVFDNSIVENCADNATVRFSDLEVRLLVWEAEHGVQEENHELSLLKLGGRLWRLEQVKRLAWEYAHRQRDGGAEAVEVELALTIALRGENDLDLPVNVNGMLFETVARATPEAIVEVRNAVLEAQTEDALAVYLVEHNFWADYLKGNFQGRLRVPQALRKEYEALEARQASDEDMMALQHRINQHEYETLLALTHEALARAAH